MLYCNKYLFLFWFNILLNEQVYLTVQHNYGYYYSDNGTRRAPHFNCCSC